jgi:hypothetical protein
MSPAQRTDGKPEEIKRNQEITSGHPLHGCQFSNDTPLPRFRKLREPISQTPRRWFRSADQGHRLSSIYRSPNPTSGFPSVHAAHQPGYRGFVNSRSIGRQHTSEKTTHEKTPSKRSSGQWEAVGIVV